MKDYFENFNIALEKQPEVVIQRLFQGNEPTIFMAAARGKRSMLFATPLRTTKNPWSIDDFIEWVCWNPESTKWKQGKLKGRIGDRHRFASWVPDRLNRNGQRALVKVVTIAWNVQPETAGRYLKPMDKNHVKKYVKLLFDDDEQVAHKAAWDMLDTRNQIESDAAPTQGHRNGPHQNDYDYVNDDP